MKRQSNISRLLWTFTTAVVAFVATSSDRYMYGEIATVTISDAESRVTFEAANAPKNSVGNIVTNASPVTINFSGVSNGTITPTVNGSTKPAISLSSGSSFQVDLPEDEGTSTISVLYTPPTGAAIPALSTIDVEFDETGPILRKAEIVEVPTTGTTLLIEFEDDDLNAGITKDAFKIYRRDKDGTFTTLDQIPTDEPIVLAIG